MAGRQPGRDDYTRWVGEGWRQATQGGENGTAIVQVRAYTRTRNGRREQVDSYTQTRKAALQDGYVAAPSRAGMSMNPADLPPIAAPPDRVVVVFISGAADVKKSRRVAEYVQDFPVTDWRSRETFTWDDAAGAEAFIRSQPPGTRIRLVGHSYGGDTAAQIAADMGAAGSPLDMLVTIDPVGHGTSANFFERVHQGARRWINVNATGGSSSERSNLIAGLGGSWDYAPMGYADEFINVPETHIEFGRMMEAELANGRSIRLETLAR